MNKTTSLTLALLIPLLLGAVLLTLLDVTQTNAAPQNVIVVDTLIDENDGSCADGDCSLRDAIATAQIEDTINFSVNGTIDIATLGQLTINNRLTINGGNAITITGNNATRLFKITGGAVTFDGLTLTNGFPTTADCSTGSQICGGALSIESGTAVTITNSLIQDNQADRGGAIYAFFSAVHIDNSTFLNNSSDDLGGAIMMTFFGDIIITDSLFDTNSSAQSVGGALFLDVNSATITDSTFTNNLSDRGGAIYASSGNITIQNSTIYDNFARETGGGIQLSTGMHLLQNVTVSDNFAEDGGGGILNSGNTKIINSTITENRARTTGAGIMSAFSSNILTTMTNTLVVDNTVAVGGFAEDVALYLTTNDTFVSGGNNMIGALGANVNAFSSMTDLVNVSVEQLGPLQDNGGATLTHALLADSLAINAANSSACPALDQRGVLRPQGSGCDIGAFELDQFLLNLTIDGGGDGAVVSSPAGINCTEDCMGTFAAGSTVSLTATASSDATFMGWSGACSGTAVCQLTLDESKEVTATFVTNEKRIYLPLIMRP